MSYTIQEIIGLLQKTVGTATAIGKGASKSEIDEAERSTTESFPQDYKEFLLKVGSFNLDSLIILGVGSKTPPGCDISSARLALSMINNAPTQLLPIATSNRSVYACIDLSQEDHPIVWWNLGIPAVANQNLEVVSESFYNFLHERILQWQYKQTGLKILKEHVAKFEKEYSAINKLPRNYVWRPYRFCSQDVVMGLVVVKHSMEKNNLKVNVCLTSDLPEYEPGSAARMVFAFLLSEAFKCGGTMEIEFTDKVEDGKIPKSLCTFAADLGVVFKHIEEGRITPQEAKQLYLALTGFPEKIRNKIDLLSKEGKLSPTQVCYAVNHGVWTRSEVESILFSSSNPNSIFGGETFPEERHLYLQDIMHARVAILGTFLDRKLIKRNAGNGETAVELEDDARRLNISFQPEFYAKLYESDEDIPVPWDKAEEKENIIPSGFPMSVLIRARDSSSLALNLKNDLEAACQLREEANRETGIKYVYILVPYDFEELPTNTQKELLDSAKEKEIGILVCPETVTSLDTEAAKRFATGRIMRE